MKLTATLSGVSRISGTLEGNGSLGGSLAPLGTLSGTLSELGRLNCTLTEGKSLKGELTVPKGKGVSPFIGEYTYTPTRSKQTIPIAGLKALQNITIEPIPQNYGLITWNGSTITVS